MSQKTIDARDVRTMFIAGANALEADKEEINDLNVFPVPDGDTGTNMTMTIMSAVDALDGVENVTMDTVCRAVSSGSLRGARGNSGVILSQLFRGFTKVIRESDTLDAAIIAAAFQKAVDTAYKAVMKPKEGTILTVAKAMAQKAVEIAAEETELDVFFETLLRTGDEMLEYTPELLPVLKEAGVVDSGGKGLMVVLHGAVAAFRGETDAEEARIPKAGREPAGAMPYMTRPEIETDTITFGYCTEFIVLLDKEFTEEDEEEAKTFFSSIGDSLVLVSDDTLVKIHVHTNDPGIALQKGLSYGQLTKIKIDNMREEHRETLFRTQDKAKAPKSEAPKSDASKSDPQKGEPKPEKPRKAAAFLAVSSGEGLNETFRQLGVDAIITGGQSMNPSTADILKAIEEVNAEHVYVLPNNKNIILAANQAKALTDNRCTVHVIPTRTIPQGITALVSFVREDTPENNEATMTEAIQNVKTAEITYAVRDTSIDGRRICQGDVISIGDHGLLSCGKDLKEVILESVAGMADDMSELVTVYTGSTFPEELRDTIGECITERFPDLETEVSEGGQPVYYCFVSVE
ncbi:MAG: DAK2 domain-containing protein [Lachnospiraceae bacterium]|nr:DAK2 domain-containing protein [Lachnospiraceae bacterium]